MKLTGEEKIPASCEQVWKALNDPEILKKSITGCKELSKNSDTEFSAIVQAKIGPVKALFKGDVKLSKLKPPESYVISGQGKGGVAGFAKGKASVKLAEDGDNTILTYNVDAQVGGKLAQIGSRLIGSAAKKMADDFFKKFAKLAAADPKVKTTAKKAVKNKVAAKKSPVSKKISKTTEPKLKEQKLKEPKPAEQAEQEPEIIIQRPAPNPLMVFVLAALGAGIILFFFLMFGDKG